MTSKAEWNYIEPVFRFVTWMVVLISLLTAFAFESFGSYKIAIPDSVVYGAFRFSFVGIQLCILLILAGSACFAFTGLSVFLGSFVLYAFTFCRSVASCLTGLTRERMPIFCVRVLVKLRQRFNFFASATLLRYDGFRHNQFPKNWLCYEPLQGRSLCGFLYYTNYLEIVK